MKNKKSHEGGLDARALSWPLHFVTGRRACTLTRDSFSAISLVRRFYARTSPLDIPALIVSLLWTSTLPIGLYSALPAGPARPYGPLPSQNMSLPRIIFAPPVVGREAVQRVHGGAWAGGRGAQHRIPVHALSVRRSSSSCITRHILVFLPLDTPSLLYAGFDVL
jgi:hypothetical protein